MPRWGHVQAQNNLGVAHERGDGVPQDYAAAANWYRKAAEQGLPLAQRNIGYLYEKGQGVRQDYTLAHMWFSLAAANGNIHGADHRDMVAQLMTPAQIAKAQKLEREWRAKHGK